MATGKPHGSLKKQKKDMETEEIERRMSMVKHTILVLSGKGGVGKSTIAVNLAASLSMAGKKVGLMDIDIHGPSVPTLLGLNGHKVSGDQYGVNPIDYGENLKVISIAFLIPNSDDAVIWRGPLKYGLIKQFLKDVNWGELDYMIVDSPPGTGDEPLSIVQLVPNPEGAIVVTTPQDVSINDVRKSIEFCRKLQLPVLGVIENMSGLICPHCGELIEVFKIGGGKKMADNMKVPFLGAVPLDPEMVVASDLGVPFVLRNPGSPAAKALSEALGKIMDIHETKSKVSVETDAGTDETEVVAAANENEITLAIPTTDDKLDAHFGHCKEFYFATVDMKAKKILNEVKIPAPPHEPGLLPVWVHDRGARILIAGGLGSQAQQIFNKKGIEVIAGAPIKNVTELVSDYISGALEDNDSTCDH